MWNSNEAPKYIETQNTWWLKSSSLEDQKNEINTQQKANKLVKIHTFLESIEDTKEDEYKETLLKLDKDSLNILLNKPQVEILQLLQKSDTELQTYLIQAQIDELKSRGFRNLSREEKIKYGSLKKELIALEKQETRNEKIETLEARETDIKLAELRGVLLSNPKIDKNPQISRIRDKYLEVDNLKTGEDSIANIDIERKKQKLLDEIIDILKKPWTLESIADDLGWVHSEEYETFKIKMLHAEPNLRPYFDRVELGYISGLAKVKLWTSNIEEVDLNNGTLSKTEDGVTTSYSNKV